MDKLINECGMKDSLEGDQTVIMFVDIKKWVAATLGSSADKNERWNGENGHKLKQ